jgi:NAD(P)-dependent dehydrogenase (short-subunit alcohol dehydrogenase family)
MYQRVIAVTGAFGALGSVVCRMAAGRDFRLAQIVRSPEAPAGSPTGPDVLTLDGVDLTDPASTAAAIDAAAEHFGRLDALLNIAGGFRWETVAKGSADSWIAMHRLNLLTASNAARAAIPHLRRSTAGRIVNVGANGALKPAAGMGPYSAAKAGVHALTQSLADELKVDGITVNAVLPSTIDTVANRVDMPKADASNWVSPEEIAEVMLFLAGAASGAVTGALIPVTGRT